MNPSRLRRTRSHRTPQQRHAARVLSRAQVRAAVERMAAPSGTARFAAGKALSVSAEKDPARVYPYFDAIAALLRSDSKVVCWNAMRILAALAAVDTERKVDTLLDGYLAFIRGGKLISAANAIRGAGRIALARPDLLDRIIPAIFGVERAEYETPECRNVAIGQALQAIRPLGASVHSRADVAAFIRRQKSNTRTAVAACAEELTADLAAGV